ncbi:hypothetical protein ONV78_20555 [Hahella sp. CR1]|uniref:hypothetical protein n=1 Tax=Hahella sp. CR1 TaxID=2992807 RepID=UPI002442340B|nr:hypothetical protein [Hahella sp. CR1]MDG9670140.1 hypothetical protein [Hahella sp. CR1]
MLNKSQIFGPDYNSCPLVSFSLADSLITLRLPSNELKSPSILAPSEIDTTDPEIYTSGGAKGSLKFLILVEHGWFYKLVGSPFNAGTLNFHLKLSEVSLDKEPGDSLLSPAAFDQWLVNLFRDDFAPLDKDKLEELALYEIEPSPEHMWVYPKSKSDFNSFELNNSLWRYGQTGHPSVKPHPFWLATPLSNKHALTLGFSFGGFSLPNGNMIDNYNDLLLSYIKDFLEHFHIQYSPETLAEMEQYK